MRPAHCKEMGIITHCLPPAPQANRISTLIHGDPQLSTGFAVSFAVKYERKNAGCELFPRARTRRKKSRNLCWLRLFLFSRITHRSWQERSPRMITKTMRGKRWNEGSRQPAWKAGWALFAARPV